MANSNTETGMEISDSDAEFRRNVMDSQLMVGFDDFDATQSLFEQQQQGSETDYTPPGSGESESESGDTESDVQIVESARQETPNPSRKRQKQETTKIKSQGKPAVVRVAFTDFKLQPSNRTAQCLKCQMVVTSGLSNTSNWIRHLRETPNHEELYEKYRSSKCNETPENQQRLTSFFSPRPEDIKKWNRTDPEQKEMRAAWVEAIVMCNLPISLPEHPYFRKALEVSQPKFNHIDRRSVATDVNREFMEIHTKLRNDLSSAASCSITVDIWSDRKLRSFLGVTVHYITESSSDLKTNLLCCLRIKDAHTGDNIRYELTQILDDFEITEKVTYIISDNASNMKKAFQTHFYLKPNTEGESDSESDEDAPFVADKDLWSSVDLPATVDGDIELHVHLRCFSHSLQLVVNDGLKTVKGNSVLMKCTRLSTLLHTSTAFKNAFEVEFGETAGIPQAGDTRWNSTFIQLLRIEKLDQKKLNKALDASKHAVAKLTPRELEQLKDFLKILSPFYEITQKTQGEKNVTVSQVMPSVVLLIKHLKETTTVQLKTFQKTLTTSLKSRFEGLFKLLKPDATSPVKAPFGHKIYLLSTVLDPNFGMNFLRYSMSVEQVTQLMPRVQELLQDSIWDVTMFGSLTQSQESQSQVTSIPEEDGRPSLFAGFEKQRCNQAQGVTSADEVTQFLAIHSGGKKVNAVRHWQTENRMLRLRRVALQFLSVPASSAPVERVFSTGGHILSARRGSMAADTLTSLMVLKCNKM